MKTKKELENLINEELKAETIARRENIRKSYYEKMIADYLGYNIRAYLPIGGYKLHKMPSNKPLTLLQAKEQRKGDFVAFVNVNSYMWNNQEIIRKIFFDITEDKKTVSASYELRDCCAYKDARKDEGEIYLLSNEKIADFSANYEKRQFRHMNRATLTGWERFNNMELWQINDTINHTCGYYKRFYVSKEDIDKSGYITLFARESLKQRAEEVKRKKAQERREKITAEWNESDHTAQAEEITAYLRELKNEILKYSDFNALLIRENWQILETLRELYLSFNKQLNFNNYNNIDEWEKYKAEKVAKYNFYMVAISRGVFSRLACFHHYEKTATGYQMKETEKDPFWRDPARYIQAF